MPKFNVGDEVERTASLAPAYMKKGVVIRVIPDKTGQDHFTEYEVDFGQNTTATFYETELRLVKPAQ